MHEAVVCLVVLGLIQPHSLASSVPGFRICELPDLPLPEKKDTTLAGLRGENERRCKCCTNIMLQTCSSASKSSQGDA